MCDDSVVALAEDFDGVDASNLASEARRLRRVGRLPVQNLSGPTMTVVAVDL